MKKAITLMALLVMMMSFAMPMSAKGPTKSETLVLSVNPQMSCQNCENKIKSNLRFEKGVTNIATSLENQSVTITFNPEKTDKAKIIAAFKKIGYTATEKAGNETPTCGGKSYCSENGDKKCCGGAEKPEPTKCH
ncbi:MAG: heavy-metal-associated domain-containing protein [Bacteroides sp.]|nr:heavy-metal-associated domain-containing protein [Bacteroides sp.]